MQAKPEHNWKSSDGLLFPLSEADQQNYRSTWWHLACPDHLSDYLSADSDVVQYAAVTDHGVYVVHTLSWRDSDALRDLARHLENKIRGYFRAIDTGLGALEAIGAV